MTPPSIAAPARRPGALATAIALTALIVGAAPVAGQMRSTLQAALGPRFARLLVVAVCLAVGGALWASLRRHRPAPGQLAAIAGAVLTALAWTWWTGNSDPAIRAVELVHFVEYGAITALFHRAFRDDGRAALLQAGLAAFLAGIAEEAWQWWLPARVGELRDVWLNAVAIGCALAVIAGVDPPAPSHPARPVDVRRVGRLVAAVVLALAAFVHTVHLGADVVVGSSRFLSRFTAATLDDAARERWASWGAAPPLTRPGRLSREDQYASEGLQHVQARNRAATTGDAVTAWHENLILERFFAPLLDTPSYVSASGHRWSQEQRAGIARAAGAAATGAFESAAFPYPLYRWSPAAVWTTALVAAAIVLHLTRRRVTA